MYKIIHQTLGRLECICIIESTRNYDTKRGKKGITKKALALYEKTKAKHLSLWLGNPLGSIYAKPLDKTELLEWSEK